MKSLKELLNDRQPKANAFGRRLRKNDGTHVTMPGHVTDFVEQDGDTRVRFDPANYADKNWNWVRNSKSKKKYDVYHRVSHRGEPRKTDVVDKT